MADTDNYLFDPVDVSEPMAPRKEIEIIEEALAVRRRDWLKTHMSYIYAAIGVVLVAAIAFGIHVYFSNTNPLSCFSHALSKNFGTSFDYDIDITEDGEAVMSYDGSIVVNRNKHTIQAHYDADYGDYSYSSETYATDKLALSGNFYDNEWVVRDCADDVQDFFDFDRDFRSGGFDGGAFLRFTKLTSNYSTREMNKFIGVLKNRLSTDSDFATVTTGKVDGGTLYTYNINLYEIFSALKSNGASVFYRATDYDQFVAMFDYNKSIVQASSCTVNYVIDSSGYMTSLDISVVAEGREYGATCKMSNFGSAEVEFSDGFLKAAKIEIK